MPTEGRASDAELLARFPRVFVTGGSGFIGSHVVQRLIEAGSEVVVLLLPGDRAPALDAVQALAGPRLSRVTGDLTQVDALARAMEGASLVIHLAAIYAIWLPRPRLMWEVNVEGTRHIVQAARRAGVRRVVHTSSIAAVGLRPGHEVADEDDGFSDWGGDDYVVSKYVSELEALAARHADLDVVVVNPAFPFGPNDSAPTPTGKMVLDTLRGRMPFVTTGGFCAVDVRDVAEGHLLAALRGQSGRRYILGAHNVSFGEFSAAVAEAAGRKPPRLVVPPEALIAAGRFAEAVATRLTRRPPMMTERSVRYLAGNWRYFSCERARRELGYSPRPLADAIRASVAWFREQRLAKVQ
ncbi:MAG: SDR family oxidoreductase [Deltaproteobacteria bacterium]|nr:SDR family oxidoreductase [Deltaproteobacteria bacterium]